MCKYDVIVLGGGPGGYMAAETAGEAGLRTLLIEERALGGTCLNEGCIPTKTLLYSAKLYDHAGNSSAYGVNASEQTIDHAKVIKRKNKVSKILVAGVKAQMENSNVEVLNERGRIAAHDEGGYAVEAGGETYRANNLIVATGSVSAVPPIDGVAEGLASGFVKTSREILDEITVPSSLAVIGAGVIGLEIASYYNSVGTEVTVIEMTDKIAGPAENEISAELKSVYEKKGIKFILGAPVSEVADGAVHYIMDGEEYSVTCEEVLLCVGRKPFCNGIGLEEIGAETEKGSLLTDVSCRTNLPGLYGVGDVNGRAMLAHMAYREAECAVNNILGIEDEVDYNAVPSVLYTDPEMGSVGYTEEAAREAGYENIEVVKLPMRYSGRYLAENERGTGFVKIVFDRDSKTMIGAHFLSPYASEFLTICTMIISLGLTLDEMKKIVFPHPAACEIIREAIRELNM